jgi:predicted nuclease of predicted toxin-antitoxin system
VRFLADENFPRPALEALRDAGLDVVWIADSHSGATDIEVLELCMAQRRVLLTFDKDFGELAFIKGLPAECGIVLFRIAPQSPKEIAVIALSAIQHQPSWSGYFSVVTRKQIRMRPLTSQPSF